MTERALAMELVVSTVAVTARELSNGRAPHPAVYVANWTVFGALSIVSRMYPPAAGVAAAFGGLVVLAELVNPGGPGQWLIGIFNAASNATANATPANVTTAAARLTPISSGSDLVFAAATTPPAN